MLKEGRKLVFVSATLTILVWFLTFKSFVFYVPTLFLCLLTLLLLNFFRDPQREIKKNNTVLYSPADGKIFEIQERDNTYCIKIFMSIFDVHIQRAPVDCIVERIIYEKGKFYPAGKDKTEKFNERNTIILKDKYGAELKIIQLAGIAARRIICWVREKDNIVQGSKIGAIMLGSQVNFEFPKNIYKLLVSKGQKVYAGISIVAVKRGE
ncbi:MAG: phosphatidylserine decarboxylase [Endomicrobia bacterium]|nr:phosphatidylserine decarboxylase [Endomicrobiia bacterium]MCX7940214.1 phosphatidylserine decarboxylase [Endomicrobiia bacterium]MDW8055900.1 phosphatidylserine decarboxylase [Elusimicrobiota bacterium]